MDCWHREFSSVIQAHLHSYDKLWNFKQNFRCFTQMSKKSKVSDLKTDFCQLNHLHLVPNVLKCSLFPQCLVKLINLLSVTNYKYRQNEPSSFCGHFLLPFYNFLSCFQRRGGMAVHQEPPGEAHAATEGSGSLRPNPQQRGRWSDRQTPLSQKLPGPRHRHRQRVLSLWPRGWGGASPPCCRTGLESNCTDFSVIDHVLFGGKKTLTRNSRWWIKRSQRLLFLQEDLSSLTHSFNHCTHSSWPHYDV